MVGIFDGFVGETGVKIEYRDLHVHVKLLLLMMMKRRFQKAA